MNLTCKRCGNQFDSTRRVKYCNNCKVSKHPPAIKETDIQRQVKEYLQWNGWFVFKNHQSLGSYKGIADLYALKGGRGVWVEIKTPTGTQL